MTYLSFTKVHMGTDVFHHPPRNNLYLTSKVKVVLCCDPGNYEHIRLDSVYLTKVSWERKKSAFLHSVGLGEHQDAVIPPPCTPGATHALGRMSFGSSDIDTPKGSTSELVRTVPQLIGGYHPR